MKNPEFVASVLITIILGLVIAIWVPGDSLRKAQLALAYGLVILLFLFGFLILAAIASGKIDISTLLSESGGGASMSRFQLLIFTLVIAMSFLLIVVATSKLPDPSPDVLALLGISASTYAVSKGIQAGSALPPKAGSTNGSDGNSSSGNSPAPVNGSANPPKP